MVERDGGGCAALIGPPAGGGIDVVVVERVDTVDQAAAVLAATSFDAVLFDIDRHMGDWSGDIRRLVAVGDQTPVVVLLGSEDEDAIAESVRAGAQDYLVKGKVTGDVVRRAIRYSQQRIQCQREFDRLAKQTSERRRMEEALRESQNRIQAITESLFEGVLVTDGEGFIAFSNLSADGLLGDIRGGSIAGKNIDTVFRLREGDQVLDFAQSPLGAVVGSQMPFRDDDAVFQLMDGRTLMVAYACSPFIEEGVCKGVIISFRDIQNLKKALQDALQASKLASVGRLAAGMAHEINTPIQYIGDNLRFLGAAFEAVVGLAGQLRSVASGPPPVEVETTLTQAFAAADMDFLIEEIPQAIAQSLDGVGQVARIVLAMKEFSHPGEREKLSVDLNRCTENTLAVCRNELKDVAELRVELAEDLPSVRCHPGEINQVLLNVVINAAHAIQATGRSGKGVIGVATRRQGRMADVVVSDDGIGMSEQVKERIFDPFFTTKEIGKGTGQGLAICRDVVVTKHGGSITVESQEGVGTTFTISLPIDGEAKPG